jgi:hypothetical protein
VKRAIVAAIIVVLGFTGVAAAQSPVAGLYGSAEYLLWWTKDSPAPVPLVTDDLFAPGTRVFLGGDDIDLGSRNGGRFTLGYQFNPTWAAEMVGFFLSSASESRSVAGSGQAGAQALFIPFIDPTIPGENVTNLSLPGAFSGSATESLKSHMWGIELNAVRAMGPAGPLRWELLGGFRYLKLSEAYSFTTSSPDVGPGPVSVFNTSDVFDATNDFYGAQLGARVRYQAGPFTLSAAAKLALGLMHQHMDIAGSLVTNQFTVPTVVTYAGGYFAQPTNIGSYSRNQFAVVPEASLNVGYRVTSWLSIIAGYTFLYASNVARPGEQIDRTVNPTQSPSFGGPVPTTLTGEARPRFKFEGSDFWAHGLSFGIALSF